MKKHFHIHIKSNAGILTRAGKDPYTDWAIVLVVSFVATMVLVYFSVMLFLSTSADVSTASPTAISLTAGTLNKTDLVRLVGGFQDKQARTALFQSGYQGAPDPSGTVASSTFTK